METTAAQFYGSQALSIGGGSDERIVVNRKQLLEGLVYHDVLSLFVFLI